AGQAAEAAPAGHAAGAAAASARADTTAAVVVRPQKGRDSPFARVAMGAIRLSPEEECGFRLSRAQRWRFAFCQNGDLARIQLLKPARQSPDLRDDSAYPRTKSCVRCSRRHLSRQEP